MRSGHHCAQPILRRFGLETTVRPSLAFYNTYDEIDLLVCGAAPARRQPRAALTRGATEERIGYQAYWRLGSLTSSIDAG